MAITIWEGFITDPNKDHDLTLVSGTDLVCGWGETVHITTHCCSASSSFSSGSSGSHNHGCHGDIDPQVRRCVPGLVGNIDLGFAGGADTQTLLGFPSPPIECGLEYNTFFRVCGKVWWVRLAVLELSHFFGGPVRYAAECRIQGVSGQSGMTYGDFFTEIGDPNATFTLPADGSNPPDAFCDFPPNLTFYVGDCVDEPDMMCHSCPSFSSSFSSSCHRTCYSIEPFNLAIPQPGDNNGKGNLWGCKQCCWDCVALHEVGDSYWEGSVIPDCTSGINILKYDLWHTGGFWYLSHQGPASLAIYRIADADWDCNGGNTFSHTPYQTFGQGGEGQCILTGGYTVVPHCCDPHPCPSSSSSSPSQSNGSSGSGSCGPFPSSFTFDVGNIFNTSPTPNCTLCASYSGSHTTFFSTGGGFILNYKTNIPAACGSGSADDYVAVLDFGANTLTLTAQNADGTLLAKWTNTFFTGCWWETAQNVFLQSSTDCNGPTDWPGSVSMIPA